MTFFFSGNSSERLNTCDKRLVSICKRALSFGVMDFSILEGVRSYERQKQLFHDGKSKTLQSKHLANQKGMSEAVDILPYPSRVNGINVWNDPIRFHILAGLMFAAASLEGVQLRWGGDWDGDGNSADQTFLDFAHFELKEK